MGRLYDPWLEADRIGVTVIEGRLRRGRWGEYRHEDRLVVLARGMTHREARSTLAHEVQHALAGDTGSWFGPVRRKQELLAERRAALVLIDADEYAAAERLREGHLASIAFDLDVIPEVVRTWRGLRAAMVLS